MNDVDIRGEGSNNEKNLMMHPCLKKVVIGGERGSKNQEKMMTSFMDDAIDLKAHM